MVCIICILCIICVVAWNPFTYLLWVEYAHNSLVSVSTEVSPFIATLG